MTRSELHVREPEIDSGRKKRLGQFFTGRKLARLLAALCKAHEAHAIVDPMGGKGDMLAACAELGASGRMAMIEVDRLPAANARQRFARVSEGRMRIIQGNAFDPQTIARLPDNSFDLVITNPPYVRYQNLTSTYDADITLPSSAEVRSQLLALLPHLQAWSREDRDLFQYLIASYSGLSDLAVPSWLLCALLTKARGTLAMVVPESWLSRDYAQLVQYLLLRWFRIRFVIEDAHAVWFPEALVKTTLVIAERIDRRSSAFDWNDEGYLHVRILAQAGCTTSIVGNLYPEHKEPEREFAAALSELYAERRSTKERLFTADWTPLRETADNLKRSIGRQAWLDALEPLQLRPSGPERTQPVLPGQLMSWAETVGEAQFSTLAELGVQVSQGLRTGANQFFYVDRVACHADEIEIAPDPIFGIRTLRVPAVVAPAVLRRQSEIKNGYLLRRDALSGHVFDLNGYALPEDMDQKGMQAPYRPMPKALADLIRVAAKTNVGTDCEPEWIPELSAVRPNVRLVNGERRFWYMLPPFTRRHMPDVFIARVNSGHPRTILNCADRALIDANFSALWLERPGKIDVYALLAVLNSCWCLASMELIGSVMGGGALKLEATHLRRIPIPRLKPLEWQQLSALGHTLVEDAQAVAATLQQIDCALLGTFFPKSEIEAKRAQLKLIADDRLQARRKSCT